MTQALNLALLANNVNTSGQLNGATGLYGTISVSNLPTVTPAYGGTGTTATPTNGQIHIGNGSGFTLATLTAGTGMSITNGAGSITLNSSSLPGVLGQVFTSNGTFTIPSGVTALKVTVVGGGGGGAGGSSYIICCTASSRSGGGGAGAGAAISYLTGLTPGNTISVTVGVGGSSGSGNSSAGSGGTSSVSSGTQSITTVSATGGGGGTANNPSAVSTGGSGSGGTINMSGTSTNGILNISGGQAYFIAGGSSIFGGNGKAATSYGNSGGAGGAPGAGGGGGTSPNAPGSASGGAGALGIVIFEW